MPAHRIPATRLGGLLLVLLLTLSGCATGPSTPAAEAAAGYPRTVDNCGTRVVFDAPPEKVMLLESAPVTTLDGIGVLDTVSAKAGRYPAEYYDADLAAKVDAVPSLTDRLDPAGHLEISTEQIIAAGPDLVLGLPDTVSRQALADAGIDVLVHEMYCPGTHATNEAEAAAEAPAGVSFDTLYDEIRRYGTVFDTADRAADYVGELRNRVRAVEDRHPAGTARTAAVLYPTLGGGALYAYGTGSMAQPQLEALGLDNVFGDQAERVFEIQPEALVAADPDVLVILHQGDAAALTEEITRLPGMDHVGAVEDGRVFTQLFNFTEPASPLTVTGLEHLADELEASDA